MKKYFHIFKTTLLEKFQCFSDLLFPFIVFGLIIFSIFSIWSYIYVDINTIGGYTLNQIMWYVLLAEALWFGVGNQTFSNEISYDIKSGNIACKINKPYNYVLFLFAKYLGDVFFKIIIFILTSATLGIAFVGTLKNFSSKNIFFIILVYVLGIAINTTINIIISLSSFWIEENIPIRWFYEKIMLIFGIVFPLETLPASFRSIAKFTPVALCIYNPIKLTVDFSMHTFLKMVNSQILWLVGLFFFALFLYKRGLQKINVNGG